MDQVHEELQEDVLRYGSHRLMILLKHLVLRIGSLEIEYLSFLCYFLGCYQNNKTILGEAL